MPHFTPSFALSISLLESEEPLHVCTLGSRGPSFIVMNLYSAMLRSKRTQLHRMWLGVARNNYCWQNLIWRFSHQSTTHQIKVLAKFSAYTVTWKLEQGHTIAMGDWKPSSHSSVNHSLPQHAWPHSGINARLATNVPSLMSCWNCAFLMPQLIWATMNAIISGNWPLFPRKLV